MLQNHATLKDTRNYLHRELLKFYPEGETNSIISLILEHSGLSAPSYMMEPQRMAGPDLVAQINEIVTEIHTHKPIQYILGQTWFCDLKILVNENALIPRPETEEMVYLIIEKTGNDPGRILDLGTGSGCIALALKKQFPEALVTGLDHSRPALDLAKENGIRNHLEVQWIKGNMLDPLIPGLPPDCDLVVSNPPYVLISEQAHMNRNVLDFEPHSALFVEDHFPLRYYLSIAEIAKKILSPKGTLWVEINERFGKDVARLLTGAGLKNPVIHTDIHEKERFIQVSR